ncbi:MAG TPA: succinylglutamate desuccinylase/aspartoacylase family protein [Candidatus Dormibacteraeota bacterium]|nr:succinylglutamate desuccinylase/aspartoacylase family protein [Candidatus Dormibacteraeota bacterium]
MPDHRSRLTTIPVHTLANGHQLVLHVHEMESGRPGPTLGVIATIHGDEPLSIEIVRRLLQEVDLSRLRGRIRALPVANPYAYQSSTRNLPLDMSNLNRIFPGDPDGMLSEQLAHVICSHFLPGLDALVDLHSGGIWPTVDYAYIHDEGADLSRVFGLDLLFKGPSYAGSLGNHARQNGIPTVVSELGGGQADNERFIGRGVRGIVNVMRHLGMLPGRPELPDRQTIVHDIRILRPHHGGMMLSEIGVERLGQAVPVGTLLGRVVSPYTFETLEEVRAPFDPSIMVLTRQRFTKVEPGDYGFMVADGAGAETV